MKRVLSVLAVIIAVAVGAGFYFGYLHVGAESANGITHITLTVNQNQFQTDEKKVVDEAQGFGHPSK